MNNSAPITGKYRFIGENSLGYKNGKVYHLKISQDAQWVKDGKIGNSPLCIERTGLLRLFKGKGYCPYSSDRLFWLNWEKV